MSRKQRIKETNELKEVELLVMGWVKNPCADCEGKGVRRLSQPKKPQHKSPARKCKGCEGRGWTWLTPAQQRWQRWRR